MMTEGRLHARKVIAKMSQNLRNGNHLVSKDPHGLIVTNFQYSRIYLRLSLYVTRAKIQSTPPVHISKPATINGNRYDLNVSTIKPFSIGITISPISCKPALKLKTFVVFSGAVNSLKFDFH